MIFSVCNGVRNCKGGWDEEICVVEGSAIPLDFSAAHVIIILIMMQTLLSNSEKYLLFNSAI